MVAVGAVVFGVSDEDGDDTVTDVGAVVTAGICVVGAELGGGTAFGSRF